MTDTLDEANAAIRLARTDPETARQRMTDLERRAPPEDRGMFAALWEGLELAAWDTGDGARRAARDFPQL